MNPWQFTRSVRALNRLRHIARVLTQHGFGHLVARMDLARYLPLWVLHRKRSPTGQVETESLGRRLTRVATELGPTFVKLGQMLTTRPDLVPEDILRELRALQDDVEPFDTAQARAAIENDLGRTVESCFREFAERPVASGSIGQVYRAVLHDGADVMVKVRRPDIESTIAQDIQLLKWLAESLQNMVPEVAAYRPTVIVQEFEQVLRRELDYVNEASATHRMAEAFRGRDGVRIPHVHWEFCSARVLTVGMLAGRNVEQVLAAGEADEPHVDRRLLARRLANAYLDQVFEIGLFHADPHPGNILVEPPATIGLIDFGQVGTITPEVMTQLVIGVYAAVSREVEVVVDVLAELGALGAKTQRSELARSIRTMLDKYHGLPLRYYELGTMLSEFSEVVRAHDVFLPREVIVLVKALAWSPAWRRAWIRNWTSCGCWDHGSGARCGSGSHRIGWRGPRRWRAGTCSASSGIFHQTCARA
jgi:ubiquinone biosynthesis protein